MPSVCYEGQPLTLLEAFALGSPVIGSDHGGIGETLASLDPTSRVSPGDADDLARAIEPGGHVGPETGGDSDSMDGSQLSHGLQQRLAFQRWTSMSRMSGRQFLAGIRHRCYRGSVSQSAVAAANIALNDALGTWRRLPRVVIALSEFNRRLLAPPAFPRKWFSSSTTLSPVPDEEPWPPRNQIAFSSWADSRTRRVSMILSRPGDELTRRIFSSVWWGKRRIAEPGQNPITFEGRAPRQRVIELMLGSRAIVFPSRSYEGQPMALLESMAAGLPMIVSSLGGIPETVGSAARLVNPGSVDELAATIANLGTMDVDNLGLAARRRWRDTFSPVVGLKALEQVYAEAKR